MQRKRTEKEGKRLSRNMWKKEEREVWMDGGRKGGRNREREDEERIRRTKTRRGEREIRGRGKEVFKSSGMCKGLHSRCPYAHRNTPNFSVL